MSQRAEQLDKAAADYDVAIVGAGLAGSLLAASSAQQGWRVLLVEKDRFPRHKVCGEFLSPESQQSLRNADLYEAVARLNPIRLTDAMLVSRTGTALDIPLPGEAWGISRYALDHALAEAAQSHGAVLREGSTVRRIEYPAAKNDRYQLTCSAAGPGTPLSNELAVSARTVVLASGRNTAKQLRPFDGDTPIHSSPHNAWKPVSSLSHYMSKNQKKLIGVKAHFSNVQMPNRVELFLFDGGYVGINPLESGAVNVSMLATYDALHRANRIPAALFDQIKAENASFAKRLVGAKIMEETLCSVAPVDTNMSSRPWSGTACVGDVATMIPPLCGDGMAMALRSAELCAPLLAQFLRGDISQEVWRQRYTQQWHTEFNGRLRTGRLLQWMLNGPKRAELLLTLGQWLPSVADAAVHATRGTLQGSVPEGKPTK